MNAFQLVMKCLWCRHSWFSLHWIIGHAFLFFCGTRKHSRSRCFRISRKYLTCFSGTRYAAMLWSGSKSLMRCYNVFLLVVISNEKTGDCYGNVHTVICFVIGTLLSVSKNYVFKILKQMLQSLFNTYMAILVTYSIFKYNHTLLCSPSLKC